MMSRRSKRLSEELEEAKEVICWLANALHESEGLRIRAMQLSTETHDIAVESPVVRGIEENRLIVGLGKHAKDDMPRAFFEQILNEKNAVQKSRPK